MKIKSKAWSLKTKGRPIIILFEDPSLKKSGIYFEQFRQASGSIFDGSFRKWIDIAKLHRCPVFDNLMYPGKWALLKTVAKHADEEQGELEW